MDLFLHWLTLLYLCACSAITFSRMRPWNPRGYFKSLRDQHSRRPTINTLFARNANQSESGLVASYNIALLIAKSGLPFTVGESLVIPAIKEAISTVMERDAMPVIKAIPLSNDTVARRIREMSLDTEQQLCATLRVCPFSIQLDETTTADNNALLMGYVRYLSGGDLKEDFLFGQYLATDTRGQTIFAALTEFLQERAIPMENIIACATDGAMVGRYRGFATLLKHQVPHVLTVHCVLHRHNLVAKNISDSLHQSLNVAVKSINKIKSHALNDRLFRQLCGENDEAYQRLLFHTEVRWLSKRWNLLGQVVWAVPLGPRILGKGRCYIESSAMVLPPRCVLSFGLLWEDERGVAEAPGEWCDSHPFEGRHTRSSHKAGAVWTKFEQASVSQLPTVDQGRLIINY